MDTRPLVALFDPADGSHRHCLGILKTIKEPICTTTPVLTEAFHLLSPGSAGCLRLMQFVEQRGLVMWFMDDRTLDRAFDLMVTYSDRPMDFADASLVTAAEALRLRKVFTLDRGDFDVYRIKRGHRHYPFQVIK
ncbi:MAG: type II toxin-antitoxin system VapC family toxin [Gammaproteobacteria bacterium]